jgi:hypothetical protein
MSKSRKQQSRPPILRTSLSHSSLFSPTTTDDHVDDLSGSPPRSAPPPRSSLRHSKSTSNFLALGRTWTRSRRRGQPADHAIFSAPTSPIPSPNGRYKYKFTLERQPTSASTSSSSSDHTARSTASTEGVPHSLFLPAEIWPRFVWDPSTDPAEIDLGLDGDEDDHDNRPVFAEFFQRLRDIEAELDVIEARGRLQK